MIEYFLRCIPKAFLLIQIDSESYLRELASNVDPNLLASFKYRFLVVLKNSGEEGPVEVAAREIFSLEGNSENQVLCQFTALVDEEEK